MLILMLNALTNIALVTTDINAASPIPTNEYAYFYTHDNTTDCTNTFGVFIMDTIDLPGSNRLECLAMCTREPLCSSRVLHEVNSFRCLISEDAEACPRGQMQWLVKVCIFYFVKIIISLNF